MVRSKRRKSGMELLRRRDMFGFVFLAPWIIGFTGFFLYPLIRSVILSFQNISIQGGLDAVFIGADNYHTALFKDPAFIDLTAGSLLDLLVNVPVCLVFSFFVAVLLRQKFRGNFIVKAIFFLPVVLGTGVFLSVQTSTAEVQGMAVQSAMEEGLGSMSTLQSINIIRILNDIGIPKNLTEYISGPVDRIYSVISMSGVQIFIFLAGLNSINPSVYEAAYIEGATGWVAFWKITFPMVSPVIVINVVYSLIDHFTMSTNKTMNYISEIAFKQFDYGLSSAMSWLYCSALMIIVGVSVGLISKRVVYQA